MTVAAAPRRRRPGRSRRHIARRVALNLAGLVVLVVMAFPVYWMVATAFKPGIEITSYTPHWVPYHPTLQHFSDAIHRPYFWDDLENSLIVVSIVVVLSVVLAFLAAVALAKYRFSGWKIFIVLVILIQMLPQSALIIPLYVVLARYHQVNQLSGLIITYLTFVLPFSIWMLRGFILGIRKDTRGGGDGRREEPHGRVHRDPAAARRAGLGATSIFAFIQAWNDCIFAYILLSDQQKQTLTVWLAGFLGRAVGPTGAA